MHTSPGRLPACLPAFPQVARVEAEVQAAHITAKRSREALALAQREVGAACLPVLPVLPASHWRSFSRPTAISACPLPLLLLVPMTLRMVLPPCPSLPVKPASALPAVLVSSFYGSELHTVNNPVK
jgi:hypothetical protein